MRSAESCLLVIGGSRLAGYHAEGHRHAHNPAFDSQVKPYPILMSGMTVRTVRIGPG